MGPASDTMTTDMSASDSFSALKVSLPRLAKNGENWLTYQEKVTNAIMARNLWRHLNMVAATGCVGREFDPPLWRRLVAGSL